MSIMPAPSGFRLADAMQPVAFEGLFGWLHQPKPRVGRGSDVGVVICSPLGRDARCAHLPMRLFAERLAEAGYPTLRYDHMGTGDSLDLPPESDLTPEWLRGVSTAMTVLRRRTGVRRVVLAGVRLGATFAAMADDCDGLILFAPVVSGRSWVRKLRFSATAGAGAQDQRGDDAALDTDGLHLSAATARSLAALDLLQAPSRCSPVMLVTQSKITESYARHLAASGAELSQTDFPGYDGLFLDAHSNLAPMAAFDRALTWLETTFPARRPGPSTDEERSAESAIPSAQLASPDLAPAGARERAVRFGEGLWGVLCHPDPPSGGDSPAVLFCNTGGDPRSGLGRFATQAARSLARVGVASLRFDFAGLGDSPMPSGEQRSHVYETERKSDWTAAVDLMREQGYDRIHVVGVCAGAYHAVHAALDDVRIVGAFAISPAKLIWRDGDSLDPERIDEGRATRVYIEHICDPRTWMRLARGRIDLRTISRLLSTRVLTRLVQRSDDSGRRLRGDVARLSARGGRIHMLMGVDDASLDEVETHFGPLGARLAALPGMSVEIEPGLDHGLARRASRETALRALSAWLGGVPDRGS